MVILNENTAGAVLKRHSLKVTELRVKLLRFLSRYANAVPQQTIERCPELVCDRVTLYRMLIKFEQLNIIHKVFDSKGKPNYLLAKDVLSSQPASNRHLHFSCLECNAVYALDNITPPPVEVPAQFTVSRINTNVVGICPACKGGN